MKICNALLRIRAKLVIGLASIYPVHVGNGLDITKNGFLGESGMRGKSPTKLDDLDFADHIALLSSTKQHIQEKTA